jgi:UDP-glucose 4-epimerase
MNTANSRATILVTGGTGFIGSHTVVELLAAGYRVVMIDNLCNSDSSVVKRIERIAQAQLSIDPQCLSFHEMDVRDGASLTNLFKSEAIDGVIHFAGLKAVGESFSKAWDYWNNNVAGTINLTGVMHGAGVKRLVFSSSATVYGEARILPVKEDAPTQATNPYGRTKLVCEQFLTDLSKSNSEWQVALLRYFNPVGAHKSALIGEAPRGVPNNLMPFVTQVAAGIRPALSIFGRDYPTRDGTCIRDYIHVCDLAKGHVATMTAMLGHPPHSNVPSLEGLNILNFGTGQGVTVQELVDTFVRVTGQAVPIVDAPRRLGDVPELYADPSLALNTLGWRAQETLESMCQDAWAWQSSLNPKR